MGGAADRMGDSSAPRRRGVLRGPSRNWPPQCRPRASGDGSPRRRALPDRLMSAPRQRGWFPQAPRFELADLVGPAPAGVVPPVLPARRSSPRRPRASGGGSVGLLRGSGRLVSAPRQPGWFADAATVTRWSKVGPAPAGVGSGNSVGGLEGADAVVISRAAVRWWTLPCIRASRGQGRQIPLKPQGHRVSQWIGQTRRETLLNILPVSRARQAQAGAPQVHADDLLVSIPGCRC